MYHTMLFYIRRCSTTRRTESVMLQTWGTSHLSTDHHCTYGWGHCGGQQTCLYPSKWPRDCHRCIIFSCCFLLFSPLMLDINQSLISHSICARTENKAPVPDCSLLNRSMHDDLEDINIFYYTWKYEKRWISKTLIH